MAQSRSALGFILLLVRRGLLVLSLAALALAALAAVQKTLLDTRAGRPIGPPALDARSTAALDLLAQVHTKLSDLKITQGPIGYVTRTAAPASQSAQAAPATPWLELATFALAPVTLDPGQPLKPKYPAILASFATRTELDQFRREHALVIALDFPDREPGLALLRPQPPQTAPATAPATRPQTMPEGK